MIKTVSLHQTSQFGWLTHDNQAETAVL